MSILKSNENVNNNITYKSLIIGAGSIGLRHIKILKSLSHEVRVVTKRKDLKFPVYPNSINALNNFDPNYIIISNDTDKHIKELKKILTHDNKIKILVEKPLANDFEEIKFMKRELKNVYVGYNLRYHPFIKFIKNLTLKEKFLSANIYVGQYLPYWRENRNYRHSYSSDLKRGGGTLLELSHEFDYMLHLFGKCLKSASIIGKISNLEINCSDSAVGILKFENCEQVSYNLNLLDRIGRREIILNTNKSTYKFDLVNNTLITNNKSDNLNLDRNDTYTDMHLDILNNNGKFACSFKESINVLKLIKKIQKSCR